MEYFTLNNGTRMPMAGIGTFMIAPADAEIAVESALRSGVRLIDTANAYMNESAAGRGIKKSDVARKENLPRFQALAHGLRKRDRRGRNAQAPRHGLCGSAVPAPAD